MLPAVRWLVVAMVAVGVASPPLLARAVPARDSDLSASALRARISDSRDLGWSGEVTTLGTLQVPLTGSTFGGVARILGEQTRLRAWWRDDEHWRVDRIRASGEADLVRDGDRTVQWTYESGRAQVVPYSSVRLPEDADVLPSALATRMLQGARAGELTRLDARRVAGRSAPGLRLVPSDSRSTIARVDLWADERTGLPLRVEVYADRATLPILTSEMTSLDLDRPSRERTSFPRDVPGVRYSRDAALDEAAGANAFAPLVPPDEVADLPRRGDPADFGAVGVYGRGPTAVLAVPLRESIARGLRDQLRRSSSAEQDGPRTSLRVGPLSVLLLSGDRGGYLLTGTVTPETLEQAATDVIEGVVFRR